MTKLTFDITPIAIIDTPFQQKFTIPRQPNLANAPGIVKFTPEFADPRCLKGIETFSHLWLLFIFHETLSRGWKAAVKAPRLGGNNTLGVFASRSTHRPNGIGMSVVKNEGVKDVDGQKVLLVSGVDLLNGTPIVDIKPYLPYADALDNATDPLERYASIPNREVTFSEQAASYLQSAHNRYPQLQQLIQDILRQDPRPAYKHKLNDDPKTYHAALYDLDVSWRVIDGRIHVSKIAPADSTR
ncbi:tRNA (N6-threonylcarbamoyladenosine(37)-N6)-methyltransferase TrmO [Alteromonas pelagimontana]|uniref:tRNA (N6-threonylcarbamoyladenosine(37)-N6)-methyltransferase TrmO n=1 Tax=Alteromonas pelagimontana TaxID=1858656 RepID=A0A6M4MHK1_9ALTE|nr:tRNA (N6-threonylcarbamoyladenosine(37)-N6)-methyltransferase TrmO [Alteromonas pelagimontana]QJR82055.1 tRNA (N6-threonylcarbamoyladenosine(37)-N6)-methyltransferase TrmO [Alteromonas pelagimontana]